MDSCQIESGDYQIKSTSRPAKTGTLGSYLKVIKLENILGDFHYLISSLRLAYLPEWYLYSKTVIPLNLKFIWIYSSKH